MASAWWLTQVAFVVFFGFCARSVVRLKVGAPGVDGDTPPGPFPKSGDTSRCLR